MSEGFLGRWSRRKRGLEQEPPEAAPAPAPAPEAAPPAAAEPEFDPATLPPLESLDQGGDLTAFLHPKVPALLRQAALRRVWAADPGIRDFVGPADYAWDYNAPDGVPGFSFDLGKVDLKKLLAQFTGQPQEPEEEAAGEMPEEAPAAAPEQEALPQPLLAEAPPPPENPLRLSTPVPEPPAEAPAGPGPRESSAPEDAPPPRRRHGGAMPRIG